MHPYVRGRTSETLAAEYLQARGWTVLARNYRVGHKEIDIIASRGVVVAFIEVKARAGRQYGHPLEAITWKKRREVGFVARTWVARHGSPALQYRFDAIAVIWQGQSFTVEHVENAWSIT